MENLIIGLLFVVFLLIVQQTAQAQNHRRLSVVAAIPTAQPLSETSPEIEYVEDVPEHDEGYLLDIFQKSLDGKRELLVHELREISAQYDTSTFFEKNPEVHRYIFDLP